MFWMAPAQTGFSAIPSDLHIEPTSAYELCSLCMQGCTQA